MAGVDCIGQRDKSASIPRWVLTVLAGLAMLALALQLGRVDARLGAPFGPDRLLRSLDASPEVAPVDAMHARRILHDRPIDGAAYRVLAQVAGQAGQAQQARRDYQLAIAYSPRDRVARATLAEQAFAGGDIDAGLVHIDALLRVAPASRGPVLALLMTALDDPRLRRGLVSRLALDPPWRAALPAALTATTTPPRPAEALLAALAARTPLAAPELEARLVLLQRLGRAAQARKLWLATLPSGDLVAAGLVFDGGFERPGVSGVYAWQFNVPAGVSLGYDRSQAPAGQSSLAIEFGGRAVGFSGVGQALALGAGRYRLRLMARNQVDTTRPFQWRVLCPGHAAPLAQLDVPVSPQWQALEVDFEVPPACGSQTLQLRHAARSLAERKINGTLGFDALEISPLQ